MFTLPDRFYKTKTQVQGASTYVQEGGGETNNQNWDPGRRRMYKLKRTLPPPHPTPPHPTPTLTTGAA